MPSAVVHLNQMLCACQEKVHKENWHNHIYHLMSCLMPSCGAVYRLLLLSKSIIPCDCVCVCLFGCVRLRWATIRHLSLCHIFAIHVKHRARTHTNRDKSSFCATFHFYVRSGRILSAKPSMMMRVAHELPFVLFQVLVKAPADLVG